MSKKAPLQFVPFNSCLDTGFWQKLSEKKLNVYGLDDQPLEIHGFYFNGDQPGVPCVMNVDFTAFDRNFQTPVKHFKTRGTLNNTNTLDRFKECDKKELLNSVGRELWNDICSGRATDDTSLLSRFYLLTYADLKKYHYYYWFSFPCLCFPGDVSLLTEPLFLGNHFTSQQLASFLTNYDIFQNRNREWVGYFAVIVENETIRFQQLKDIQNTSVENKKVIFCFCDPSSMDEFPGWPLRNFLLLIAHHWRKFTDIEVICLRDRAKDGVRSIAQSLVLNIHLGSSTDFNDVPKCVGWEKNERQKLGPRMVNLSSSMDPSKQMMVCMEVVSYEKQGKENWVNSKQWDVASWKSDVAAIEILAESAVDLNLKLMRWRLIPELNLEKVANTKCLLLGSGTLGCNIARCLMGWGVRNITFVDNGKVSYSNPVRQSLFVFDDCMLGGRPKAEAAAEALKRIFPGVNADAVNLSIPMPGHHIPESLIEQTQKDVDRLTKLIENHDVVFLLMDTRESRWLPTLIAAAKYKLVINAALGFDTFLVLRHGMKTDEPQTVITKENFATLSSNIPGSQLGCYFCNDVVAPGNSTKDRTLDQQCTVSRPGMSMIASALAVELMVSILQHKLGPLAPADTSSKDEHITMELTSSLGLVPHQIRGFLSRFHNIMPANRAFNKCTACSDIVIENYRTHGFDFLIQAFNDTSYLEDITGLTQMHQETIDAEVIYLSDDDDGSSCVDST